MIFWINAEKILVLLLGFVLTKNYCWMKKYATLLFSGLLMCCGGKVFSQISGDNCFIQAHYIEVAIAPNGSFGSTVALPSGIHHNVPSSSPIGVYDHATGSYTSTANRLAMIYDAGHDGWTTGSPAFFGDYTLPGSPYEGWDLQIGSAQAHMWYTNYQSSASGYSGGLSVSGSNTYYTDSAGTLISVWTGTAGSGGALAIVQTTSIDTNASWINVTTTFKNTSSSTLSSIYYQRAFDPDNDAYASGGSTVTTNTINYQNDYYHRVEVTAAGTHYTSQTVALATKDCRAKCWSGSWPTYSGISVASYYAGGSSGVRYTGSERADNAIGLVYNLGSLAAGDSTSISYAFVFNGSHGIDSAVSEPQLVVNGSAIDSLDTVYACSYSGDSLFLNIINGNTRNWAGAVWRWSPSTSLFSDTGVSNGVLMSSITSSITYTITGTDSALGTCESKQFILNIAPTTTSPPTVTDVTYCAGATASALTATGTGLLWYTSSSSGTGSSTAPTPSTSTPGTTIYYVSQTVGTCESVRVPLRVSVMLHPSIITGPSGVCSGSTVTYADSTAGGTWASSDASVVSIGSSTGVATIGTTGTAVLTYTATAGCSITDTITVNIQPGAISGASAVCTGTTITLSSSPSGGTWSTSAASTATVTSGGAVTGVTAGTVTISYTFGSCYSTYPVTVSTMPTAISGPRSVCNQSNITLTSSGTGTWTSSATSVATVGASTGIVGGASAGTAVISYSTAAGCRVFDTITVNPIPSSISGPSGVCAGSTISLSATPTTGTWTSSSATNATVTSSGGVVTGVNPGSAIITYSLSSGCYSTTAVTVNIQPVAISGVMLACASGGTTSLSDGTSGGSWSSSNTSVATVNSSGTVTGVGSGTDTITYAMATGCKVTTTVTVNPLPKVIDGPGAVCIYSSITLSDTVTGGLWTSSNSSVASVNSSTGVVSGVATGGATISYSSGAGCTTTHFVTVNGLPPAITGTMNVCEAGSVTHLSDAGGAGSWSTGDASKATVDGSGNVTGVSAGTVDISYTLTSTGCSISASVLVNPLPSAISGPTAVCQGLTIGLSDGGGGTWLSGNTTVATITSGGVVGGASSGSSVITYTLPTGCQITSNVTVNPLPAGITGTTAVCVGLTSPLADATGTGSWSSSDASKATVDGSGTVTGVGAGSAIITYTLGTGCIATTTMTINGLPATISGAIDVCNTYNTLFTESSGGGSWSSNNSAIATINSAGLAGGASVGSTTISYILSATGCYQTASLTVNALPVTITGTTTVCVGSTTTLSDASTGGTWTSGNTSVATVVPGSGVVTGVSAGTAVITYTNGAGCYITTTVNVNPLPANISGTLSVCEGSTVALSDGSGSGTWSSSNTSLATVVSSTGVVSGISAGGLTITFTLGTGCKTTSAFVVNTTPVAITGTTSVCEAGGMTPLADATVGGGWTSGATSIATVGASTGMVTGVSAGTVTITYMLGTCYNTTSVIVRPLPGAIITPLGDTMLCPGDFVALTSTAGTGYAYQWFTSAGAISGETDNYYISDTGGRYSVSVTSDFGCTSYSVPMTISVNPVTAGFASVGATTFCAGLSSSITATSGAGISYQWVRDGIGIAGATSVTYYPTTAGDYSVVETNLAGCYAESAPVTISTLPAPAATLYVSGALTFCDGGSVTLSADTTAGITYQWQNGGIPISGATDITYTAMTSGNYQVVETNGYSCNGTSAVAAVTALALPSATITSSGSTTFCTGSSVLLSAPAGASGTTYQWYNGGVAISGAVAMTYLATHSGNFTVRVTSPAGCINTTYPSTTVQEVTTPVITPYTATKFCWGGSALLGVSVSTSVGVTYRWQKDGIDIPGATNSNYNATTSGAYSCIVTIAGGCTTAAVAVTVTELPLPDPIIYFDGNTLTTANYYVLFQWYRNLVPLPQTGSSMVPDQTGDYTVKVVDSNGCQSVSTAYIVRSVGNGRSLGMNTPVAANEVTIYPNPANNRINIVSVVPLRAVITSLDGRKILEQAEATEMDISSLSEGIYMVTLYDKDGQRVKVEKLIKE